MGGAQTIGLAILDGGSANRAAARDLLSAARWDKPGRSIDILVQRCVEQAVRRFREPAVIYETAELGRLAFPHTEEGLPNGQGLPGRVPLAQASKLVGLLPGVSPEWLGNSAFTDAFGCRFPYLVGEMARGIATARMVVAAGQGGLFGFFGSAGLRPDAIRPALAEVKAGLTSGEPWGANLIHCPDDPDHERMLVDLFLEEGVRHLSASAFLRLSPEIVRFSALGLSRRADGSIERHHHVFAKVSRPVVARQFLDPPKAKLLRDLVASGRISPEQAELQSRLPVAEALTVEADSGGHTDNRPLASLFHSIAELRSAAVQRHGYDRPIFLGAAGGIGTPAAAAAAFKLGADYILTGSVNQSAVESGLSRDGRLMLAEADMFDMIMAPAADMFELGAKVQVLKRGTFFAMKAHRLYDLYRRYGSLEALPGRDRFWLETAVLREDIEEAWAKTRAHHEKRNPRLLAAAEADPKKRMALLFRRFLFMGAHWAREGLDSRRSDYQIWCGPAMGAFNVWAKKSFLEDPAERDVQQIGLNLMEGAALVTRAQQLRSVGVAVPSSLFDYRPRRLTAC